MKRMHGHDMPSADTAHADPRCGICCEKQTWEPLLYDYAEGLCEEETAAAVCAHLRECTACRASLAEIREMLSALQTSVPAPKTDIGARVMDAVYREEEADGSITARSIDARSGRSTRTGFFASGVGAVRQTVRALSGIAAVLLLAVGFAYGLPMLRNDSGAAASPTQEILQMIENGEDNRFSDGVFVGVPRETAEETEAYGIGAVQSSRNPASADTQAQITALTIVRVTALTEEQLLALLSQIQTENGASLTVTPIEDGWQVSPLSSFDFVKAQLSAAYPQMGMEIVYAETAWESYRPDTFCVQIGE